jgi:hypothetical protein
MARKFIRQRRGDKIITRANLVYEYWYADCSHTFWIAPPWCPEQECPSCAPALAEYRSSLMADGATDTPDEGHDTPDESHDTPDESNDTPVTQPVSQGTDHKAS